MRVALIRRIMIISAATFLGLLVFLYVLLRFFHFSSNSAALYILKDKDGLRISNDVALYELDSLVFRIDLTGFFNRLFETSAMATSVPLLDVDFNISLGRGVIKEFRPDGSRLEIALSRFDEPGVKPKGLIIGGDFPLGDSNLKTEASGIAYYDGNRWFHLWCNANEGISLTGGNVYDATMWKYQDARVIKRNFREFLAESTHEVELKGNPVMIRRIIHIVAGRNFIDLIVDIKNLSKQILTIDYAYGDEPWIGEFGTSKGDVGWYEDGLITRETYIDPLKYNLAGFWDVGNPVINEKGEFTGLANYIQWIGKPPTMVYISNDFYTVDPVRPLISQNNRVLNLVWKGMVIAPGEIERIHLRIGYSYGPVRDFALLRQIKP